MASLKPKSFTTVYDFEDDVLGEDYNETSFETWKFKAKSQKNSTFDYEAKFEHKFDESGYLQVALKDKVKGKFSFYDDKYWFWFGKKNKDLKFHVDFGKHTLKGKELNFFTNWKTTTDFKKFAFRAGVNHFGQNVECNSRVEMIDKKFWFTQRNLFRKDKLFFGQVSCFGYKFFCLQHVALGFEDDKQKCYFQHQCCDKCTNECCEKCTIKSALKGNLSCTYVYSWKDYVFGLNLGYGLGDKSRVFETAVQSKVNDNLTLKGKVATVGEGLKVNGTNVNLLLAAKYKLNDLLKITATTAVPLKSEKKTSSGCCSLPFGLQFEVNL